MLCSPTLTHAHLRRGRMHALTLVVLSALLSSVSKPVFGMAEQLQPEPCLGDQWCFTCTQLFNTVGAYPQLSFAEKLEHADSERARVARVADEAADGGGEVSLGGGCAGSSDAEEPPDAFLVSDGDDCEDMLALYGGGSDDDAVHEAPPAPPVPAAGAMQEIFANNYPLFLRPLKVLI